MSVEAIIASMTKGVGWLPFILASGDRRLQFNTQRMIEAVIIGLAIALVGYMTVVPRLEERLAYITDMVKEVKIQNDQHMTNGHPYTTMQEIKSLNARVQRLEQERDMRSHK